jgi:2-polyprenyl-3-methyl-5-hydroxy-6-metoxy-1,4-benzoquinol methylase
MNTNISKNVKTYIKRRIIGTQYEWQNVIDNIFRILDANLKTFKPYKIIDIGCGDGSTTARIASYFDINMNNVYGVEYNDDLINISSKLFNVDKIDLEVDDIPYENNTFDLVICNQVLEHLKHYRKVIDDLIRITSKEGYIIIGIPNLAHLLNRIYLLFGSQPLCIHLNSSHVRSFTHKSFAKMLISLHMVKLLNCKGSLMYPLPYFIANNIKDHFIGLNGYVCYLLQKMK